MKTSHLILLAVAMAVAGCTSPRMVAHPEIQEPEIRRVVDRLNQLKPGMTKPQVWKVLGKLPLEDKVVWVSGGSDWGEGCDCYLLKHGYSLRLLWDLTDYENYDWLAGAALLRVTWWNLTDYENYDWLAGGYRRKEEGPYRRAWLSHENRKRIEF